MSITVEDIISMQRIPDDVDVPDSVLEGVFMCEECSWYCREDEQDFDIEDITICKDCSSN